MALTGLLGDVTRDRVAALLHQRRPEILDTDVPEHLARYEARVRGAAVEVLLITGDDPAAGPVRDLAAEAIALEVASQTEYAEYPEQQVAGDEGRGYHLHQRYLELLSRLRSNSSTGSGLPRARMPAPLPYPDPVLVRGFHYPSRWSDTS
jgi:hypothetical protein